VTGPHLHNRGDRSPVVNTRDDRRGDRSPRVFSTKLSHGNDDNLKGYKFYQNCSIFNDGDSYDKRCMKTYYN